MKIPAFVKRVGLVTLVLGVAAGCASTQEEMAADCEGMSPEVKTAINDAKAANLTARDIGAEWRGARKLINQAEAAGNDCKDDEAMRLAREARMMAEEQVAFTRSQEQEQDSMDGGDSMEPEWRSYTVQSGDTLWGISGSSVGYNDPYQWPLIYRANSHKIDDADLIHPGQAFRIEANPSMSDVDNAISHAKTRGAWELGVVESSDKAYLSNN
jgi:nucleoid-associated protein YgaU